MDCLTFDPALSIDKLVNATERKAPGVKILGAFTMRVGKAVPEAR